MISGLALETSPLPLFAGVGSDEGAVLDVIEGHPENRHGVVHEHAWTMLSNGQVSMILVHI